MIETFGISKRLRPKLISYPSRLPKGRQLLCLGRSRFGWNLLALSYQVSMIEPHYRVKYQLFWHSSLLVSEVTSDSFSDTWHVVLKTSAPQIYTRQHKASWHARSGSVAALTVLKRASVAPGGRETMSSRSGSLSLLS
jgi:hypothetical protein